MVKSRLASFILSGKQDKVFSRKGRKAIIETVGILTFPEVPEPNEEVEATADSVDNA